MRTKRIIAVFGGGSKHADVHPCAKRFGRTIARRRQILLTGGTEGGTGSVKACAIAGAGSSPWVGIARGSAVKTVDVPKRGFVIYSDLGHQRNFVEAHMSDAVIALAGDSGTLAEVTSALALGRPVAFVGPHWDAWNLDTPEGPTAWAKMLRKTRKKFFGDVATPDVDAASTDSSLEQRLEDVLGTEHGDLGPHKYFRNCSISKALDWLEELVPDSDAFAGSFPEGIAGHGTAADDYEVWLAANAVERGG